MSIFGNRLRTAALGIALIFTLLGTVQATASTGEEALRGCLEGSVTVAVVVWGTALITAPVTGGASLVAAPKAQLVAESAGWGCMAGAGGRVLGHWLFGS